MAAKTHGQRIDALKQQVTELLVWQTAVLQGQAQTEARLESKLESIGEMLRKQIMNALKEQQSVAAEKGKDSNDHSTSHLVLGSSSGSGGNAVQDRKETGILSPAPVNRMVGIQGQMNGKMPKLEFPNFNGDNPRLWLRKCYRYFTYNNMTDFDKISLVAMNLEGVADHWFVDYVDERDNMSWDGFTKLVMERFMNPTGGSLAAQFNRLRQTGTVQAYIQEFEEMRALMREHNKALTNEYFIESFIGGLKEEIGKLVAIQKPTTLLTTTQLALQHEDIVNLLIKNQRSMAKFTSNPSVGAGRTDHTGLVKPNVM